ncbi:MAG TPA: hypothetical protein VHK70_03795 [Burkholderiaceae bacterium]|jgi:hypothetical protein|nr:hypothetical protein [Burkholderiaceae bacterium]
MNNARKLISRCVPAWLCLCAAAASAQQLDAHFSCSTTRDDGERVIYADSGEFRLDGNRIGAFRWESSLFRSTHGFDCSIDESDDVRAEVIGDEKKNTWRISLADAQAARERRGYDFFARRLDCSIWLERDGDLLHIAPNCPALCGSRSNFSALTVNLKNGTCRYEQ